MVVPALAPIAENRNKAGQSARRQEEESEMRKKLTIACSLIAALAALGFAPAASASPELTDPLGTTVAVGASITAKNTGSVIYTGAIRLDCTSAHWGGTLTKNNGTKFAVEVPIGGFKLTGTGTGSDCTSSSVGPVAFKLLSKMCVESGTTDDVIINGCGGPLVVELTTTGVGICKYSSASTGGTFLTNQDATVNVGEQESKLIEGGLFCSGSIKIDMDFDMYTTSGVTVLVS